MRWILIVLAIGIGVIIGISRNQSPVVPNSTPTPLPTEANQVINEVKVSYFKVDHTQNISLLPNFMDQLSGEELVEKNGCINAINGGFYDTNNNPLGMFVSGGKELKRRIQSSLMNGFVWKKLDGSIGITNLPPDSDIDFALQTGPRLFIDGNPLNLSIRNDEQARRMIVAQNANGFIFFILYLSDNVFLGPLLSDVPSIIESVNKKDNLNISDALNLDGGSASFFKNKEHTFSEIRPIGSLFCIL